MHKNSKFYFGKHVCRGKRIFMINNVIYCLLHCLCLHGYNKLLFMDLHTPNVLQISSYWIKVHDIMGKISLLNTKHKRYHDHLSPPKLTPLKVNGSLQFKLG